jgi:hypothetical protein
MSNRLTCREARDIEDKNVQGCAALENQFVFLRPILDITRNFIKGYKENRQVITGMKTAVAHLTRSEPVAEFLPRDDFFWSFRHGTFLSCSFTVPAPQPPLG